MHSTGGGPQLDLRASELEDIAAFLSNREWKLAENEHQGGVTWLEMFLMHDIQGWNFEEIKEGRKEDLEKQLKDEKSSASIWKIHR